MTKFPTDEQIDELEKEMWVSTGVVEWGQRENLFNHRKFVREALNRWGTPEPTDYKQLSQELYDALKRVRCFSICNSEMDNLIQKYEDETTRGTGRTTALYMKAIAEALANPGDRVEFQDHSPMTWNTINSHSDNLKNIISKLGYDIVVTVIADTSNNGNKIILTNRFKK
jgi:hypothetical protein